MVITFCPSSVPLSVHLYTQHERVVRWLRIIDSLGVFEWDLFR